MKRTIKLQAPADLVITSQELAFEEVIQDARENGGPLFISSYNVEKGGGGDKYKLTNVIEAGINGVSKICLVCNIPGVWIRRGGDITIGARDIKNVNNQLALLNPANRHFSVEVAFLPKLHAKIVATPRLAYVGSANFSSASADNWEAGVIIRDSSVVQSLQREFLEICADSLCPYELDLIRLTSFMSLVAPTLEIFVREADRCVAYRTGYGGDETEPYLDLSLDESIQLAEELEEPCRNIQNVLSEIQNVPALSGLAHAFVAVLDKVGRLGGIIGGEEIKSYKTFDSERAIFEEVYNGEYDEKDDADIALDRAARLAYEIKDSLHAKCQDALPPILLEVLELTREIDANILKLKQRHQRGLDFIQEIRSSL